MSDYTADDVRVLSVSTFKDSRFGDGLEIRLALINKGSHSEDRILLETTRRIYRSNYDEADAIRVARHSFLLLCELGAKTMEGFRIPDGELPRIDDQKG